ncbi:MAG: hypothetical protein BWY95_02706 [Bacteroidetes bacterium ADurb.BinA104]|nr:MAG: hypothetical protein BWY95_02706 [Bacteroidetes bacterium ADurb.BinA104]
MRRLHRVSDDETTSTDPKKPIITVGSMTVALCIATYESVPHILEKAIHMKNSKATPVITT